MIEEVASVIVIPVAGFLARKAARKGVAMMKARGKQVPAWVERFAPAAAGGAAGLGAALATDETPSFSDLP